MNNKFIENFKSKNKQFEEDGKKEDSTTASEISEKDKTIEINDPFAQLPPRPAAWFVLLHDLAYRWKPASITKKLVEDFCYELNKKGPLYDKPSENSAGWVVIGNGSIYQHFPMPQFETFRDLDRFLFIWNRGLKWLRKRQEKEVLRFAFLWYLAGQVIRFDEEEKWYEDFSKDNDKWFEEFFPEEVKEGEFNKRFSAFRIERGIPSKYPDDEAEQIEKWQDMQNAFNLNVLKMVKRNKRK